MPAPDLTRDETIARIIEEMRAAWTAQGGLNAEEWRRRYPGFADESLQLFDTDRALVTAASHWKVAGVKETIGSAIDATITHNPVAPAENIPKQIGRYRILRPLGQGGMGTVYEAEDPDLRRRVAIKVPHFSGSSAQQAESRQRFVRESRAAAAIQHENVCSIYDVGEDEGRPYVVMAYVEGESLSDRLERGRFDDCREAVSLVARVAGALAAVHEKGIVHRDLKPGNILIRARDGQPVLTDFGLARVENDREHATVDGTILGTAAYMSPEQAGFDLGPVTSQSDVYSLGVVLFEMLTGRRTFEGNMLQLIHKVATQTAPRASQFRADLDPALDALVARALSRQPRDRHRNADAFQNALKGWLEEPALAADARQEKKASPPIRTPLRKRPLSQRRPRLPIWAAAVGVLSLAIALTGVIVYLKRGENEATIEFKLPDNNATVFIDDKEQPALADEPVVRLKLKPGKHRFSVRQGDKEVFAKDFEVKPGDVAPIEWGSIPLPPPGAPSPFDVLDPAKIPASERFPWQPRELVAVYGSHTWKSMGDPFWRKMGDETQLLAAAHYGDTLRITDPATGKEVGRFEGKNAAGSYVSPDGRTVGLLNSIPGGWTWKLWDLETKMPYPPINGAGDASFGGAAAVKIAVSPDGKLAVTAVMNVGMPSLVWEVASGKLLGELGKGNSISGSSSPAFSPDGKTVVITYVNRNGKQSVSELVLYDVAERKELSRYIAPKGTSWWSSPTFSPDGNLVALAGWKTLQGNDPDITSLWFWDQRNGQVKEIPIHTLGEGMSISFAPDGKSIMASGSLYDVATGNKTHESTVFQGRHFVYSPDGTQLATSSHDERSQNVPEGPILVYDVATGKLVHEPPVHTDCLALSSDNKTLALRKSSEPHILSLLDASTGKSRTLSVAPPEKFEYAAFSHDGGLIAASGPRLRVWNAKTGDCMAVSEEGVMGQHVFSPVDKRLAVIVATGSVKLRDGETLKETSFQQIKFDFVGYLGVIFSPDGKKLAVSNLGEVKLYDVQTGAKTAELTLGRWGTPAFIARGKLVVGGRIVKDVATGKEAFQVASGEHSKALAHPDGKSFFTYGVHPQFLTWRGIQQWSTQDGKKLKEWALPFDVNQAAITSDGRYLITSNENGTVYVLRLSSVKL